MRRQARTWVACGAALVLGAGAAHANEGHKDKSATSEPAGGAASSGAASSGAASSGTASSAATTPEATKEMRGRVLQASPSRLFLEHMGAVVEFKIDSAAQFSGGGVKSAADLSEGQEVRASFTVENNTTNVAKRISVSPGERSPMSPGTPAPHEPSTTPSPR